MLALTLSIIIVVIDQLTKYLIRTELTFGEMREILPNFMNLTYLRNTGAAWGMFGGWNMTLTLLSSIVLGLLIIFRRKFLSNSQAHRIALGLMVGGIIGNLIDRIRLGWVTDFLDFYIGTYHWPSFNVADSAICIGVTIYVLTSWQTTKEVDEK